MKKSPEEIKQLLADIADGNSEASEALFPAVYDELHRLASSYMQRERANHTLQPTALIHEAFLKLTNSNSQDTAKSVSRQTESTPPSHIENSGATTYQDLDHFMATAAVVMRRILVNHAKAKKTLKRGEGKQPVVLSDVADAFSESAIDLVALDEALQRLAEVDEVQHRLVELRFFGGMTTKQCAGLLGISERAAYYEWSHARAWLRSQIEDE